MVGIPLGSILSQVWTVGILNEDEAVDVELENQVPPGCLMARVTLTLSWTEAGLLVEV